MNQDTGLIKRGLFLLALMSALVVVVLLILLQRTPSTQPTAMQRPELLAACLVGPSGTFPSAVSWAGIYQITEAFPSTPGWRVRFNAAGTLARRGSPAVPWDIVLEMLDEDRQMHNFRIQLQDGSVIPDEAAAHLTAVYGALKSIAEWHKKQASPQEVPPALAKVYAAVDKLADSPIMEIKSQAENARRVFFR